MITPIRLPNFVARFEGADGLRRALILANASASCFGSTRCRAAFLSASNSTLTSVRRIMWGKEKPHTKAKITEKAIVFNEGNNRYITIGKVPKTSHILVKIRFLKFDEFDP